MKKFKFILSLAFIAGIVAFVAFNLNNKEPASVNKFLVKELLADINNDNLADKIEVHGGKNNVDDIFYNSFDITVTDGDTQMKRKFSPDYLKGTNPVLGLYDFTGDKLPEIIISAENEGEILSSVISLQSDILKPLFMQEDNEGVRLNLSFGENFCVNGSFADGKKLAVNLEHVKPALVSYGIYSEDGIYKEKDIPSITGYTSLIAMDIEGDGVFELCGTQTIKTKNSNLPLCNLVSVHKYNKGFVLTDIKYTR